MSAEQTSQEFSTAFGRLVKHDASDEHIVGPLAHSRDTRDLASEGTISMQHLRQHHKTPKPGLIDRYREGALRRLETYSSEVLRRAEPDIRKSARVEAIEAARDDVIASVRTNTRWWLSIVLNAVAWSISPAITFLVAVGSGRLNLQIPG